MKYSNIVKAEFLERPNRFIAHCLVDGQEVVAHVKNTGRCRELLIKGVTVYLEYAPSPTRKTDYSLIAVVKGHRLINMDSQIPNKIAYEGLTRGTIKLPGVVGNIVSIRPEFKYGTSRIDLFVTTEVEEILVEVKGVTLEHEEVALFPDAPTARGAKHVEELISARKDGYLCYVLLIIQMEDVIYFTPNHDRDPRLAAALERAASVGVGVIAYDCMVRPDEIVARKEVEVRLQGKLGNVANI